MLSHDEVIAYCQRLGLSSQAQAMLAAIRAAPPTQRVGSNGKKAPARYPSHKMGVAIQVESYKNELPGVVEMERDDNVHEFWDQPPKLTLQYEAKNGRKIEMEYTPDYFVIRKDSLGWEEWKTEEDLIRLAKEQPHRYARAEDGTWRCPPGEKVAAPIGFYYRIRSLAEINWIYLRNLVFLEDYLRASPQGISATAYKAVRAFVEMHPDVTLRDLLEQVAGVTNDDIYTLIAHKQILVDLSAAPLVEPAQVHVFLEDSYAE